MASQTTVIVKAPPGVLGLELAREQGGAVLISGVHSTSPLKGSLQAGMPLTHIDGADVSALAPKEVARFLDSRAESERTLTVLVNNGPPQAPVEVDVVVKNMGIKEVYPKQTVSAPPGRLGISVTTGEEGGLEIQCAPDSPLFSQLKADKWTLVSIGGSFAPRGVLIEKGCRPGDATKLLTDNAKTMRTLVVQTSAPVVEKSGVGSLSHCGQFIFTDAGTLEVTKLEVGSPLLCRVAVGAEVVAINGSKDKLQPMMNKQLTDRYLVLTIRTLPPTLVRMEFILFVPLDSAKGKLTAASFLDDIMAHGALADDQYGATNYAENAGQYETVTGMQMRMNHFLATSGLKITSVETASIDGSIKRVNSGRYRSGGGDRAEWVYQTLKVWYNALDPENQRPSVVHEIRAQNELSKQTIKETIEGCVVM
eukprot:CAMPEP_0119359138 /NCGR_PEP_ID=MMETSP1334-20130426/7106_1 /TAXON_ID=127549 /ORGANISM="Calcidiscus leptoporus, Strain RCC1130" /LENGTH=422 /DNA_ID=CAMNT_0007373751 /DNA_START=11 /DNA_END=1279 /DNA_ORIENTATION=-